MDRATRALTTLATAGALLLGSGSATAQIAVATVPGDEPRCAGRCREAIVEVLDDRGIQAIDAPAGSRRAPGRRLERSGAEMLVLADVLGPEGRRVARLRAYLPDGTQFYDQQQPTRGGRHAARILASMVDELLDGEGLAALDREAAGGGNGPGQRAVREEPEDDRGAARADPRDEDDEGWVRAGEQSRSEVEDRPVRSFGRSGEDGRGEVRSRAAGPRSESRMTFLTLSAGLNLTGRTLEMPFAGGEPTREYRGGAYPGFEVSGTLYPAAPWVSSWAGSFGLHFRYGRHIMLTSYYNGQALETHQDQVDVLAQYRLPLTRHRSGVALVGGLGYMGVAFMVPDNGYMHDFVYQAFSIALEVEAPLPWAGLMIRAGGRYGIVLDMGEAGRAFAQAATVNGYEALLELSGRIVAGLRFVVAFEVFGFESSFVGAGDLGQATGAHDLFVRGRAGLAYSFDAG